MKSYLSRTRTIKNNEIEQIEAQRLQMLKLITSIAEQVNSLENTANLATNLAVYQNFVGLVAQLEQQKLQFETQLQQLKQSIDYSRLSNSLKTFIASADNLSQRLNNSTSQNKSKFTHFHRMRSYLHFRRSDVSIDKFPLDTQINYFFGMKEIQQQKEALRDRISADIESLEARAIFLFPNLATTLEAFNVNRSVKLLTEMANNYRGKLARHPAPAHSRKRQEMEGFLDNVTEQLAYLEDNRDLLFNGSNSLLNTVYGASYLRGLNMNEIYPYISRLSCSELDEKYSLLQERITLLTSLLNEVKQMAQAKNDLIKSSDGTPFSALFNKLFQLGNAKPKSIIEEIETELAAAHELQTILEDWVLQQTKSQYGNANKTAQGLVNLAAAIEAYKLNPDSELDKHINAQIKQLTLALELVALSPRAKIVQVRLLNTYGGEFYKLRQTLQMTAEMEQQFDRLLDQLSQLQTLIKHYGSHVCSDKTSLENQIEQYLNEINGNMIQLQPRYPNKATLDNFNKHLEEACNRFIDFRNEHKVAALMQKGQRFFAIKAEKQPKQLMQKTGEQIQGLFGKSLSQELPNQVQEPSIPGLHQRARAIFG